MSITTYAELQTSVTNWLKRSDLSSYTADLISLGEARLYSDLRVRAMESSLSTAISSGVIALPSDYIDLKHAYIDGTPVVWLERKSAEWVYANYPTRSAEGKPAFIAREGSNFIFGPYADSGYTVKGIYYARPSALSSALNTIFTNYPGVYLFAALAEAAPFLKDDKRLPMWEAKYTDLKNRIQLESDREEFSGSVLRMTPA